MKKFKCIDCLEEFKKGESCPNCGSSDFDEKGKVEKMLKHGEDEE